MNNYIQLYGQFCLSKTMQHQGHGERILTTVISSSFFFSFFPALMTEIMVFEKGGESKIIKKSPFKELPFASKQVAVAQGVRKWHRNDYE